MQIRPTEVKLVGLNLGLSQYLDRSFRSAFRWAILSESLSEITSLFDWSLDLDRTLAERKAQRKAKSKSEVTHCLDSEHCAFSSAASKIWNHTVYLLLSESHHHLTPSNVTSKKTLLQMPLTRTAYGSRAFIVAVPNIWNKLPAVLAVNSLNVFRRRLKTHLFAATFGDK